jgi:hypothetical protein
MNIWKLCYSSDTGQGEGWGTMSRLMKLQNELQKWSYRINCITVTHHGVQGQLQQKPQLTRKQACLVCINFKHSNMINSTLLHIVSELQKMMNPFQPERLTDVQWVFLASTSMYHNLINTNLLSRICLILQSFLTKKAGSNCNNYNVYSWDGQSKYRLGWLHRLQISTGFLSSAKKILGQNKTRKLIVNFGQTISSASNPLMTPIYYILKIQHDPTVTVKDVCVHCFITC